MRTSKEDLLTNKKRRLTVTLTDNQLLEIREFADSYGVSVDDILSNYISDLICMYDNGSDERNFASRYFERTHLAHRF